MSGRGVMRECRLLRGEFRLGEPGTAGDEDRIRTLRKGEPSDSPSSEPPGGGVPRPAVDFLLLVLRSALKLELSVCGISPIGVTLIRGRAELADLLALPNISPRVQAAFALGEQR
mmetsp:Transcript_14512/g.29308  ORF Transcript_14512/g.29308 Transcript_14512/m.29308 type:complete len:115 (-) Transcript_14512:104-448(-)